jgi:hypothetical protein
VTACAAHGDRRSARRAGHGDRGDDEDSDDAAVCPATIAGPRSGRHVCIPGARRRAPPQHAVATARFAEVIDTQTQQSLGWRRIAAFGVDYGIIFAYLGFLTLVGVLGRIVGALPTDIATPTGRVVAQLVIFAVLTVPVTAWFAG